MNYTQSLGNLTELKCLSRFIELGYECSIPYGNGAKYDFIVDFDGELLRIQCKTCSHPQKNGIIDKNAIQFSCISQTTNTKKTTRHKYSDKQIDYFATTFGDKVYVIPVNECSTSKTLRFQPPLNGCNNYNKAEDYEIEKRFPYSEELIQSKEYHLEMLSKQKAEAQEYFCEKCGKKFPIIKMECVYSAIRSLDENVRDLRGRH